MIPRCGSEQVRSKRPLEYRENAYDTLQPGMLQFALGPCEERETHCSEVAAEV